MTECKTRGCKTRGYIAGRCRTHAKKRADDAFSIFIRERDGQCQECGSRENLTAAHIFPRNYFATRWNPDNAVCLCWPCHYGFGPRPLEWELWCSLRLGREKWEALRKQAVSHDYALRDSWLEVYAA